MRPGFESDYCKDSYVGSPVKAVAPVCPACKKKGGCKCKKSCAPAPGICTAVVDDASGRVYLYGNVLHENYHVPGNNCIAYTSVQASDMVYNGRRGADEIFVGEQDQNNVTLSKEPFHDNSLLVFLNGVKQVEGPENDYVLDGNKIHFNFYDLLPSDRVEVLYEYGAK